MKKIILHAILFVAFIGRVNGQLQNFSPPSQEVLQSDLGISQFGPSSFSFSPEYFINSNNDYTYLWSFGDGQYSTEPSPTHTYSFQSTSQEYQVVLYATPIYTPIGPPPAVYLAGNELINVEEGTPPLSLPSFMNDANISLSYNRLPRASHESTFILSYRNASGTTTSAPFEIYFDFNEYYFDYIGVVAPNGESYLSNTTPTINNGSNYPNRLTFLSGSTMAADEERTIFIQMKATENVIGELEEYSQGELMIESSPELFAKAESYLGTGTLSSDEISMYAVGSWDPNNKISSVPFLNRDDISFPQKIRYRINCENIGTSSTSSVEIKDHVSPLLDFSSYSIVGQKNPSASYDISENSSSRTITVNFPTLSLEGTNSNSNVNLSDCQYWIDIEYDVDSILFEENFGSFFTCASTSSLGGFGTNAEIVFDNHPAIITNTARTEVYCEVITKPFEITQVFPNPTVDIVRMTYVISPSTESINLDEAKIGLVNVNSGLSTEILNITLDDSEGTHQVEIDLSFANPGSYIITIQTSGLIFESSVIIKQ